MRKYYKFLLLFFIIQVKFGIAYEAHSMQSFERPTTLTISANDGANPMADLSNNAEAPQQKILIRGLVVDKAKEPLVGVNVRIKGLSEGVVTDVEGRFAISVPNQNSVLMFSYIGFMPQEIPVKEQRDITLQLDEDLRQIDEVVIVGRGTQKKGSVSSSVTTIQGERLSVPTRSISNALGGKITGITTVQKSGDPGRDNAEFWIRGVSSFAGGTSPLVLVDGVPRDLNDVSAEEVETFTVLKDAAATSVYGAEGANGVILINSKRGNLHKNTITYRGEYSLSTPTRLPKFVGSVDFMNLYNEAYANDYPGSVHYTPETIKLFADGADPDLYPDVDWMSLLKEYTSNTRHNLSFRGGTERAKYFVSGTFYRESGIYEKTQNANYDNNVDYQRYNLRSNVDITVTPTTKLSVDVAGMHSIRRAPGIGSDAIFEGIVRTPPNLFPMMFSDGHFAGHPQYSNTRVNPYNQIMESGYERQWITNIQTNVGLQQDLKFITSGLKFSGMISFDSKAVSGMTRTASPETYKATGRDENGKLILSLLQNATPLGEAARVVSTSGNPDSEKQIYLKAQLDYGRTFVGVHDVAVKALYEQRESQNNWTPMPYRKQGYVAEIGYTYDRRYSINGSLGITGSENFADGHRYGLFPALGVAWNIAQENYFKKIAEYVPEFKIRASIGRTGNDRIGSSNRFPYRASYNTSSGGYATGIGGSGSISSLGGITEKQFASPNLTWEIELKRNIGVDLSFFRDANLRIVAEYFNNERSDILVQRNTITGVTGFRERPWQNFGIVTNKGFELGIQGNYKFGDVKVSALVNYSFARNKIIEKDEILQEYWWMNTTGGSLSMERMYTAIGLFTRDDFDITLDSQGNEIYSLKSSLPQPTGASALKPGDIRYADLNDDGLIDEKDNSYYAAGSTKPEKTYGFGFDVEYKGFFASVFFQGAGNVSTVLGSGGRTTGRNKEYFFPFQGSIIETSVRQEVFDRWTEANPSQDVMFPRLHSSSNTNNTLPSTWWQRNASYLRLKNVEVGYSFSKKTLAPAKLAAARIFLQGYNLYVWDAIKMWDPETGNNNAGMTYPLPRTISLGLEVTF